MTEVKVLITGYLMHEPESDGRIGCTVTLVRDNDKNIIVDPGGIRTSDQIIKMLEKENLTADHIDFVFLTHCHYDHFKNIGQFPNATVIEYQGAWNNDRISSRKQKFFSDNIEIVKTPGHSRDSMSLVVKTEIGIIAIVGDLWWQENYPIFDKVAENNDVLAIERAKMLVLADYVIPGHSGMFKTK